MEQMILELINKVRAMYKYDTSYNKILSHNPTINVELECEKLILRSLQFGTYDKIIVYPNKIEFVSDDRKNKRELYKFDNYNQLLNL